MREGKRRNEKVWKERRNKNVKNENELRKGGRENCSIMIVWLKWRILCSFHSSVLYCLAVFSFLHFSFLHFPFLFPRRRNWNLVQTIFMTSVPTRNVCIQKTRIEIPGFICFHSFPCLWNNVSQNLARKILFHSLSLFNAEEFFPLSLSLSLSERVHSFFPSPY